MMCDLDSDLMSQIERELECVTRERDALNTQIQQDALLLEQKIQAAKQQSMLNSTCLHLDQTFELSFRTVAGNIKDFVCIHLFEKAKL